MNQNLDIFIFFSHFKSDELLKKLKETYAEFFAWVVKKSKKVKVRRQPMASRKHFQNGLAV